MSVSKETRNSSYHRIKPSIPERKFALLNILKTEGELTAQELADELFLNGVTPYSERNFAAPRLTELKLAGKVESVGKKYCSKTGRLVTVWRLRKGATAI